MQKKKVCKKRNKVHDAVLAELVKVLKILPKKTRSHLHNV